MGKFYNLNYNEENPHFTELTQKVGIYVENTVLQRGLQSLDGKRKLFVTTKKKIGQPSLGQTDYNTMVPEISGLTQIAE